MMESFRDNPFILKIKHKVKVSTRFSFHPVSENLVKKVVKELPTHEAAAGEIPMNPNLGGLFRGSF